MSFFNWLLDHRDKHALAKEVVKLAHENADLKNQLFASQVQIFWLTSETARLERYPNAIPDPHQELLVPDQKA